MGFCTECGEQLRAGVKFCPSCGCAASSAGVAVSQRQDVASSGGASTATPNSRTASTSEGGEGWVVLGAVFGVVLGLLVWLLFGGGIVGFILSAGFGTLLGVASRWVGTDANSRGMDGFAWAAGTMLLAIVVFPAYLFQRSRTEVVEGTRVCPACAERVRVEASKCRFCGYDLTPILEAESGGQWLCPDCDEPIDENDPYCRNCGRELDWEDTDPPVEDAGCLCPDCDNPVDENDPHCRNCGRELDWEE